MSFSAIPASRTSRVGLVTLVNPGSVGLSLEAGGKACYAVFDGEK